MHYLKSWAIITDTGDKMGVPVGQTNQYEDINRYDYQAIIERFERHPEAIKTRKAGHPLRIHAIVFPDGTIVTQF